MTKVSENTKDHAFIADVIESLPCVISPECEIIRICLNLEVAEKVMKEFKDQHGGDWYIDDVRVEK